MADRSELFEIIREKVAEKTHTKNVGRGRIADFLGVNQGKVRAWETGQRPSSDDLELLAKTFDFNPSWLLLGEGDIFLTQESALPEQKTSVESQPATMTDPIAQRMETATRLLEKAGASPETIQAAIMKILDSQNETHTQADTNTVETPAFADKCEWSMKRT